MSRGLAKKNLKILETDYTGHSATCSVQLDMVHSVQGGARFEHFESSRAQRAYRFGIVASAASPLWLEVVASAASPLWSGIVASAASQCVQEGWRAQRAHCGQELWRAQRAHNGQELWRAQRAKKNLKRCKTDHTGHSTICSVQLETQCKKGIFDILTRPQNPDFGR